MDYIHEMENNKKIDLINTLPVAWGLHKIVLNDKGIPIDYIFLEVNSKFESFTGLKRDDILHKKVTEAIPGIENSEPNLIEKYGRVALTGEPEQFEMFFEPFDKWYKIDVQSTKKNYFTVTFEDITSSKKDYARLMENQINLDLALDSANAGKFIWNVETGHLYWDERSLNMFGIKKENFTNNFDSWANTLHPGDLNNVQLILEKQLEKDKFIDIEYRVLVNNNVNFIQAKGYIARNKSGQPQIITGLHLDITNQKENEIKLKQSSNELEKMVQERTLKLEREIQESRRREIIIKEQTEQIIELSTPILQTWDGILVAPLIGQFNSERTELFSSKILDTISKMNSKIVIIDITGIGEIDTQTAQYLIETISACLLIGTQVILTGVKPNIAQTLVHLGIDFSGFITQSTLESGLKIAFKLLGYKILQNVN